MKDDIHPAYGPVAFRDRSTGCIYVTRSTGADKAAVGEVEVDGQLVQMPVVDVDVSADSHPFWTGRGRVVDAEGRVEAFERRYGRRKARSDEGLS